MATRGFLVTLMNNGNGSVEETFAESRQGAYDWLYSQLAPMWQSSYGKLPAKSQTAVTNFLEHNSEYTVDLEEVGCVTADKAAAMADQVRLRTTKRLNKETPPKRSTASASR